MSRHAVWMALVFCSPAWGQSLPYGVADTNQSECFDAEGARTCPGRGQPYWGQDAQFIGQQPRYHAHGDGTVSDLVTGLMWERQFRQSGWNEAAATAVTARTGGHDDWRVPTIKELYSLMQFNGRTGSAPPQSGRPADARPYLDSAVFDFEYPGQGRYIDAQYISATAYLGTTMGRDRSFFGVNFADGRIKAYPQDGGPGRRSWYLRLVRGNPAYGRNDFSDSGNGTVADRATGLIWTKADSGGAALRPWLRGTVMGDGRLDWREALAFCSGLGLAGATDWRLPNAKELHSIVDYTRSPDATNSPALDPVFQATAITEADGSRNWPYIWSSTTHLDGRKPGSFAVYVAFGKAMGNLSQSRGMGGPMGGPGMAGPGMRSSGMAGPGRPPGGMGPGGPGMEPPQGPSGLLDVHGAGAQRSSPKEGDESRLPVGAGPQGDVLRIYNYARCVRG